MCSIYKSKGIFLLAARPAGFHKLKCWCQCTWKQKILGCFSQTKGSSSGPSFLSYKQCRWLWKSLGRAITLPSQGIKSGPVQRSQHRGKPMQSKIQTAKYPIICLKMNNYLYFTEWSMKQWSNEATLRGVVSTNAPYIQYSNKTLNKARYLAKATFKNAGGSIQCWHKEFNITLTFLWSR